MGGNITLKGGNNSNFDHLQGGSVNILAGSSNTGTGIGGGINISSGVGSLGGGVSINTGPEGYYNARTGSISIFTASNFEEGAGGIDIYTGNGQTGVGNDIKLKTGTNQSVLGGGYIILEAMGGIEVIGSGTYTGTWTQASDKRFKKNIEPLSNSVDKIQQLIGVRYEFRNDEFPEKNFADGSQIGLIAQDVEEVFPELVETGSDGYKSIAYQNMVPILIEAIKEQQKSIDGLKKEVQLLKSSNVTKNVGLGSLGN